MRIANNITALQSYTNLLRTNRKQDESVVKLSSGYKINSVADDAAGLAVSNRLKNQIKGMEMAQRNAMDGISLVQTAEGALTEVHAMLNRIRELAVQSANGTNEPDDREKIQDEVKSLVEEIYDTAYKTEFNSIKVLNGEAEAQDFSVDSTVIGDESPSFKGLRLQIGANKGMTLTVNIPDIGKILDRISSAYYPTPVAGEIRTGERVAVLDISDPSKDKDMASVAIDFCDEMIAEISKVRGQLGAYQNRLEHTEAGLSATALNTKAALSRIMDTDMALEMTYNAQQSIVSQAGISVLGQANQRPQQILQLLQ